MFLIANHNSTKMPSISFSLFPNQIKPPLPSLKTHYPLKSLNHLFSSSQFLKTPLKSNHIPIKLCSETSIPTLTTPSDEEQQEEEQNSLKSSSSSNGVIPPLPLLKKKRKRYRKEYPGESKGITEEMRFVAMKLRNDKGSSSNNLSEQGENGGGFNGAWEPTIEGFLKYLVDSKLVFDTIEGIVEDSNDVSFAYFRRTGLERSRSLAMDLEWFSQEGMAIPEPSNPGVSYASYLKELAEKSAPLFLSHFYNVYFAHLAGGQVIAKQVAEKLLKGRQLEFFTWEGDEEELLKEVRNKLNQLGEHWSRDDKNKCLKEATKSFRYQGQIVRLIILI